MASYINIWRTHIAPFFRDERLADITDDRIQEFINFLATSGRKDGKPGGQGITTIHYWRDFLGAKSKEMACYHEGSLTNEIRKRQKTKHRAKRGFSGASSWHIFNENFFKIYKNV